METKIFEVKAKFTKEEKSEKTRFVAAKTLKDAATWVDKFYYEVYEVSLVKNTIYTKEFTGLATFIL